MSLIKNKKEVYFETIVVIDDNAAELAINCNLLEEMNITKNKLEFNSGKEAFEYLLLVKQLGAMNNRRYPALIVMDIDFSYFKKRSFLEDILLLYPEKKNRPEIIVLWKSIEPVKHKAVSHFIQKPLSRQKLMKALKAE